MILNSINKIFGRFLYYSFSDDKKKINAGCNVLWRKCYWCTQNMRLSWFYQVVNLFNCMIAIFDFSLLLFIYVLCFVFLHQICWYSSLLCFIINALPNKAEARKSDKEQYRKQTKTRYKKNKQREHHLFLLEKQ